MITTQVSRSSNHLQIGIGLMSGTSTDGLDIVAIRFSASTDKYSYEVLDSHFVAYANDFATNLKNAENLKGRELREFDIYFAKFLSNEVISFSKNKTWKADFIASHGHTVFHDPEKGYTLQIGCGATIAVLTGLPCICDFRQGDVSLGGQGAPLVPIGDEKLFAHYDFCLNLGGFANVSYKSESKRIAFDICPLNVVMNKLSSELGYSYDAEGLIARDGKLIHSLYAELNALAYYHKASPKSLGMEWVHDNMDSIINEYKANNSIQDVLATYLEHAAFQIGKCLNKGNSITLATGGGCKNKFLIERILHHSQSGIDSKNAFLIDYKEALIFAFLGFLRINEVHSTIMDVTGAKNSHSAGAVYLP